MIFEPSPFWRACRKMGSARFVLAVGLMLLVLEGTARLCPVIVGRQVHQQFLYSARRCMFDCTNKGRLLRWFVNSRGARGGLYHGQPVQIAVFGSSTSADSMLDQPQSWPEQLKACLDEDLVHVDNYARDGALAGDSAIILDHLRRTGRRYDVVLLMVHDLNEQTDEEAAFHYWGQWVSKGSFLKFPSLLRRRIKAQVKLEPLLNRFDRFVHDRLLKPAGPERPDSRAARRALRTRARFVDVDVALSKQSAAIIGRRTENLLEAARRVADKVYVLIQPVAYDADALADVMRQWYSLHPAPGHPGCFISDRCFAESIRQANAVVAETAAAVGVDVIDLDGIMRPMLSRRADLFEDHWHFTPAGAHVAASIVAGHLRADLMVMARHACGER